eukprot:scaffold387_cov244-Pinguiococcus_pyrenoidosus.AAC.15
MGDEVGDGRRSLIKTLLKEGRIKHVSENRGRDGRCTVVGTLMGWSRNECCVCSFTICSVSTPKWPCLEL